MVLFFSFPFCSTKRKGWISEEKILGAVSFRRVVTVFWFGLGYGKWYHFFLFFSWSRKRKRWTREGWLLRVVVVFWLGISYGGWYHFLFSFLVQEEKGMDSRGENPWDSEFSKGDGFFVRHMLWTVVSFFFLFGPRRKRNDFAKGVFLGWDKDLNINLLKYQY